MIGSCKPMGGGGGKTKQKKGITQAVTAEGLTGERWHFVMQPSQLNLCNEDELHLCATTAKSFDKKCTVVIQDHAQNVCIYKKQTKKQHYSSATTAGVVNREVESQGDTVAAFPLQEHVRYLEELPPNGPTEILFPLLCFYTRGALIILW